MAQAALHSMPLKGSLQVIARGAHTRGGKAGQAAVVSPVPGHCILQQSCWLRSKSLDHQPLLPGWWQQAATQCGLKLCCAALMP